MKKRIIPVMGSAILLFLWLSMSSSAQDQTQDQADNQDQNQERQWSFQEPTNPGPFRVSMAQVIDGWRFNLRWREGPFVRGDGRFHLSNVHTPSATRTRQSCEREFGLQVRDFVRGFVRGKQLRASEVRRARMGRALVGRLSVGGEDLGAVLLEMGYAVPYDEHWRNAQARVWDCANNPVPEPLIEEPLIEEPFVEEPFTEEPLMEEPLMEEPEVADPPADD